MKLAKSNVIEFPMIRTAIEKEGFMPWVEAFGVRRRKNGKMETLYYARCLQCERIRQIPDALHRMCKECLEK